MDKNVLLTIEGARQFTNALELLNTSIRELNQIADQMIPESLLKEGLTAYLREFCRTLKSEGNLNIEFVSTGEHIRDREEVEIALFRSFRNILILYIRFSQPASIHVQLNHQDHNISIVISDDGERNIFLNPNLSVNQELLNIKAILSLCHGTLHINELQNSGNEIEIQVPV